MKTLQKYVKSTFRDTDPGNHQNTHRYCHKFDEELRYKEPGKNRNSPFSKSNRLNSDPCSSQYPSVDMTEWGSLTAKIFLVIGIAVYAWYLEEGCRYDLTHLSCKETILFVILGIVFLFVALGLQVILHELGHLVCGLLSGYRFLSFRIGPFVWSRHKGKFQVHTIPHPASLGQCLMLPPKAEKTTHPELLDTMPWLLYNLGGVLFNLIVSLIGILLFFHTARYTPENIFVLALGISGLVIALSNGIPARSGTTANDGSNMQELALHKDAGYGYQIQLHAANRMMQHKSPEQYPDTWFIPEVVENVTTYMNAPVILLYIDKLLACGMFDTLHSYLLHLDYHGKNSRIPSADRALMDLNLIYCLCLSGSSRELHEFLITMDLVKIQELLEGDPALYRTMYVLFIRQNQPDQAAQSLRQFHLSARRYLSMYPEKINLEYTLIQEFTALHNEKKAAIIQAASAGS